MVDGNTGSFVVDDDNNTSAAAAAAKQTTLFDPNNPDELNRVRKYSQMVNEDMLGTLRGLDRSQKLNEEKRLSSATKDFEASR